MIYDEWKMTYSESREELARNTWENGIIRELSESGVSSGMVLDAGAGTGVGARLIKELGEIYVISVDQSETMLNDAKLYSDEIHVGDIANLEEVEGISSDIDYIVSGFDTLNYLNRYELGKFFLWASSHLVKKGEILFDYSSPLLLKGYWRKRKYEQELDSGRLFWSHRYIEALKVSETTITYVGQGNNELWSEQHIQYSFSPSDIQKIARYCGLRVKKIRDLGSSNYSLDGFTHVYVVGT